MNQAFYRTLYDALEAGQSVELLTVLSGELAGRSLVAQKLLRAEGLFLPLDPALTPFWERCAPKVDEQPLPALIERDGFRFLAECLCSRQQLILCGGGHISLALAKLGAMLDFDTTVIDDRPEFANSQRFPEAKSVLCKPFDQALREISHTDSSYFVIVTRGHQHDRACVESVLQGRFGYCGMIGSRKKVGVVMGELEAQGFSEALLQRVYAPIGLPIGGQTPAEIAVSIAAQIVQTRCGASQGSIDREALARLAQGEPMVLVTIVEKHGSAPRDTGAKMLVDAQGKLYGSVGGGSAEAEAAAAASGVFSSGKACMQTFNMTNADAQDAGMVCGGVITVLLDPLSSSSRS